MGRVRRDTTRAQQALADQQRTGTHNPATACACGTLRTPGQTHTKGDTGPAPKGVSAPMCSQ